MSQEEIEEIEEVEEEYHTPKKLTLENLKAGLSQISQTFDGESYAYTRLTLAQLEIDELIEDVSRYEHLRFIDLSKNYLQDISFLYKIPFVLHLFCQQNKMQSLESLNSEEIFQYLQQADFSNNKLQKLTPLKQAKLKQLNLSNNQIFTCEEFKGHCNLQILELRNNKLTHVNGIKDMPQLIELNLAQNKIADLNGFMNMPMLKKLHLNENIIEAFDAQNIPDLPSLEWLNLSSNKLASMAEVAKLKKYQKLQTLQLQEIEPLVEQYGDKIRMEVLIVIPFLQQIDEEKVEEQEVLEAQGEAEERRIREEEERLERERLEKERLEAEAGQKEEEES